MPLNGPADEHTTSSLRASPGRETEQARRLSKVYLKVDHDPNMRASWHQVALCVVFMAAIVSPLAAMILGLDLGFVLVENRVLATRPELKLDVATLAEFPARFEAYFNDQFGFRKRLIHWLNVMKVAGLGVSPSSNVILGENGWLFHGGIYLDYHRAIEPLPPKKLENWQRLLESRRDWLAARGIPYLVVFVPTKNTIYAEYMPRLYNRVRHESRLDQLIAHLKTPSTLTVLDLREPLLDAKSRGQVYYRTDTHWNNRGAYVGYAKVMAALAAWFPKLETIPPSAFREERFSEPGRDLALMLAMSDHYREDYVDLKLIRPRMARERKQAAEPGLQKQKHWTGGPDIVFEHQDRTLPRAVMFRDSFATWLIPLLSEHFERIVYSWQHTLDRDLVEREQPDVVIQEMVERTLMNWQLPVQ